MIDQKFFNDLGKQVDAIIPDDAKKICADLDKNIKTLIQSAFTKIDLVTREEFDAQTKVLARSREKLERLEKQIQVLEQILANKKTQ